MLGWLGLTVGKPQGQARASGRRLRLRRQPPGSWQLWNGGVQRGVSSFWCFSITAGFLPFGLLATDYWPLFTCHAPRRHPLGPAGSGRARPSAAGYCLPPTAQLPKNERARSRRASPLFQYVTEPGDFYGQNNLFLHNAVCVGSGGIARTLECKSAHLSIHTVPFNYLLFAMPAHTSSLTQVRRDGTILILE